MPEPNPILTAALAYHAAGLSIIPIRADGTKMPDVPQWKPFQQNRATEAQIIQWFGKGTPRGIALVHGAVSGHSEALDFDQPGLYAQFADLCCQQGYGDLLGSLPLIETPSGGHHLLYRCTDEVGGNAKLAETTQRKTLIETRGQGGYSVAPGSHPSCHHEGKPYLFIRGGADTIPALSAGEYAVLRNMARFFNEYADPRHIVDAPKFTTIPGQGLRPGDDYNSRGDYEPLLIRHGWQQRGVAGDKGLWQRPGKHGNGISATSNYAGCGLFYVFSSNAAPFEPQKAYSPFAVLTLLEHGGDFRCAAQVLADQGYGTPALPSLSDFRDAMPSSPNTLPTRTASTTPPVRRKSIEERTVDLADVQPPGELPLLFGSYLLHGHAHWLTGQAGLGKSTLLFNITCALAEGTALWGIDVEPTRVLYADMESGDVGRSHKIDRLYGTRPRVRGRLFFLREPVKLPDEKDELLAFVQARGIQLVVFDTARRCFSVRDENDNAEVYNRVIPTLDALKQIGVASLTLGHPAKSGNGSARGAGAQEDAGDVNLSLTMHKGDVNDKDGVIALRVTKNRLLGLGVPPLYLRRKGEDQFERTEAGDLPTMPEPGSKRTLCRAAITEYLEALPTCHASHTDIVRAMKERGYTEATARRAKDDMEAEGELLRAVGGGYCLPDPFA